MSIYPTKSEIRAKSGPKEWSRIERERARKAQNLDLLGKNGKPFYLVLVPKILTLIAEIAEDRGFLSSLKLPKSYIKTRSQKALKKEAYYSSRIEGAVTSFEEALRHMNRKVRRFSDESMQMIYNNKEALEFMFQHKADNFSKDVILGLHKILLYNTHKDKPIAVGQYRKGPIYVVNAQREVVYEAPPPDQAKKMMEQFVAWMNQKPPVHPLVDAAIAHLYFVHVHPFDDGNGRSARALSNLYLEKNGYSFINLLSPSDYFEHHRSAYYKSIQAAEGHGNDATYFALFYLEALKSELQKIKDELKKNQKTQGIRDVLDRETRTKLNRRQIKAIRWLLENASPMTTRKYCKLNKCSDETARKDFNTLLGMDLITTVGSGRSTTYVLSVR